MNITVHEILNADGEKTKATNSSVDHYALPKKFDELVKGLELKSFKLPGSVYAVDPDHEYGSANKIDDDQWDAAIGKAARNAGGRRRRRRAKTVRRRSTHRLRRQTRRRRPF